MRPPRRRRRSSRSCVESRVLRDGRLRRAVPAGPRRRGDRSRRSSSRSPTGRPGRSRELAPSPIKLARRRSSGCASSSPSGSRIRRRVEILRAAARTRSWWSRTDRSSGRHVLDLPRLGCLNIHGSLLPRHRGASPIQSAILAGDATTGVTVIRMDAGVDTGPIVASATEPIAPARHVRDAARPPRRARRRR